MDLYLGDEEDLEGYAIAGIANNRNTTTLIQNVFRMFFFPSGRSIGIKNGPSETTRSQWVVILERARTGFLQSFFQAPFAPMPNSVDISRYTGGQPSSLAARR